MADQKISDLDVILGTAIDPDADLLVLVDNDAGANKKVTVTEFFESAASMTILASTAGTPSLRAFRPNNTGSGDPVVIVAGDGDSGDVLLELRGNTNGLLVDTGDTKESADAQFIFYGNGASTFEGPMTLNSSLTATGEVSSENPSGEGSILAEGSTNAKVTIRAADTGNSYIYLGDATAFNAGQIRYRHDNDIFILSSTDSFVFQTSASEALRIDSSQNVGIGTASPSAKLDVVGNAEINGDLTVTGTITASLSPTNISASGTFELGGNMFSDVDTGSTVIFGGTNGNGAHLQMFGGTHASTPNVALLDAEDHRFRPQAGTSNWLRIQSSGADFTVPVNSTSNFISEDAFIHDSPDNADQDMFKATTSGGQDFFKIRAENINDTTDRADIRFQGGIESVVFDLDNGIDPAQPLFQVNGQINADGWIVSGLTTGGSALTENDGGGEANVTFNHTGQVPRVSGNSARIKFNADTAGGAEMEIKMASSVTSGASTSLNSIMILREDYLRFNVNSGTEMVRLNSTGMGLGTNSPSTRLHVSSGSANHMAMFESTDTIGILSLKDNSTASDTGVGLKVLADDLFLRAGSTDVVSVTSSGDVGIGTTTPSETFEVVGETLISSSAGDALYLNGTTGASDIYISYQLAGVDQWHLATSTIGAFYLFDAVNSETPLVVEANSPTYCFYMDSESISVNHNIRYDDGVATISTGVITATKPIMVLSAESGTTDDLDTISGGQAGERLILKAATGDTITVKHATGNIRLRASADFAIDTTYALIELLCDGTDWVEVNRSAND